MALNKKCDILKKTQGEEEAKLAKYTNENDQLLKEKLEYIGLNLEKIPLYLKKMEPITFRPIKNYDDTSYKIYRYIDVKDIEILLTPKDRLDDLKEKYKLAKPLSQYIQLDETQNLEEYTTFLQMLQELDLERLKQLEYEQGKMQEQIPFEVKYKENFIWQIYYAEETGTYFMLFPTNETRTESLFYLLKKKIEAHKSRKKQYIYVPISHAEYTVDYLKRSEIADLENYLWLFTQEWPMIYQVEDKQGNCSIQITGQATIYDKMKSFYKIVLPNKKMAQEWYKLVKALFIMQTYDEQEYHFEVNIDENGGIAFHIGYTMQDITFDILPNWVTKETNRKKKEYEQFSDQYIFETESLELLKKTVQKQNEEYLSKERQIVTFLECKKTFFGRVKYYFQSKNTKKSKEEKIKEVLQEKVKKEETIIMEPTIENFPIKEIYTIEDLLKICAQVKQKQEALKNVKMDLKALENKKENLARKIQNATLYINEIESHKKSIFDFWKYTNKDEVALLVDGEEEKKEDAKTKIQRVFNYVEDFEDFGKAIDDIQRRTMSQNECDGVYVIKEALEDIERLEKTRIWKKDTNAIEKRLEQLKEQYILENKQEKSFDIFGNIVEDKTKIKVLKNQKHREIAKDKYKLLNIHKKTTLEEYIENIKNCMTLVKQSYGKVVSPYDMHLYQVATEIKQQGLSIFSIDPKMAIEEHPTKDEVIRMNKVNLKEGMPAIFYSNIMFYDNLNQTLPLGMDLSTDVLLNLDQFDMKLISRKDFRINVLQNVFQNQVKVVQVFEYMIERKPI